MPLVPRRDRAAERDVLMLTTVSWVAMIVLYAIASIRQPRVAMLAWYMPSSCVCLSVCLSVCVCHTPVLYQKGKMQDYAYNATR